MRDGQRHSHAYACVFERETSQRNCRATCCRRSCRYIGLPTNSNAAMLTGSTRPDKARRARHCPLLLPLHLPFLACLQAAAQLDSCSPHSYSCVSIRRHMSAYVSICQSTTAYVSIRQHTSAYVSIRQHTSAYVSQLHAHHTGTPGIYATDGRSSGLVRFSSHDIPWLALVEPAVWRA